MRKLSMLFGLLAVCTSLALGQQVVINEYNNNGGSVWIEVANLDPVNPATLDNWVLQGAWDNPANAIPEVQFTFPVGTVLMPGECLVVEEAAGTSGAPLGTQLFLLPAINPEGVAGVPWFVGLPLSMAIYDDLGNGVDYFAGGQGNAFDTPLFTGMGIPTAWTGIGMGIGAPVLGTLPGGFNAVESARNSRVDTNGPADWTVTGQIYATPGVLNHHQNDILSAACGFAATVPAFTSTMTSGCPPLVSGFTNVSTGPCELNPMFGASVTWDLDATANPGVTTVTTWHANRTFLVTSDVTLTIVDSFGNMATSPIQTITVFGVGAPVPQNLPKQELFDGFPAFVANPCTGATGPDPITGWEHARTGNGRVRVQSQANIAVGFAIGNATGSAGPVVCILDAVNTADESRMVLHFDGTQGGANGYRFRFSMFENFDEIHDQDVVALSDGVTMGNRINRTGLFAAVPGHNGHREMLIDDWNTSNTAGGGQRIWHRREYVISYAQLTAAGLTISGNMELIFRQFDNVTFEGNDGILLDQIHILPDPPTPGLGQPSTAGQAVLNINGAINANFSNPGNLADPNGPYFATVTPGGPLNFTFTGQPFQAIILATGALGVGTGFFGAVGQLDLATTTIISDGFSGTGFLPFSFVTDAFGRRTLNFGSGVGVAPGTSFAMQAAITLSAAPFVRLTNVVNVTY